MAPGADGVAGTPISLQTDGSLIADSCCVNGEDLNEDLTQGAVAAAIRNAGGGVADVGFCMSGVYGTSAAVFAEIDALSGGFSRSSVFYNNLLDTNHRQDTHAIIGGLLHAIRPACLTTVGLSCDVSHASFCLLEVMHSLAKSFRTHSDEVAIELVDPLYRDPGEAMYEGLMAQLRCGLACDYKYLKDQVYDACIEGMSCEELASFASLYNDDGDNARLEEALATASWMLLESAPYRSMPCADRVVAPPGYPVSLCVNQPMVVDTKYAIFCPSEIQHACCCHQWVPKATVPDHFSLDDSFDIEDEYMDWKYTAAPVCKPSRTLHCEVLAHCADRVVAPPGYTARRVEDCQLAPFVVGGTGDIHGTCAHGMPTATSVFERPSHDQIVPEPCKMTFREKREMFEHSFSTSHGEVNVSKNSRQANTVSPLDQIALTTPAVYLTPAVLATVC